MIEQIGITLIKMKYTDTETRKSKEQHRADIHRKIKTYLTKKAKTECCKI